MILLYVKIPIAQNYSELIYTNQRVIIKVYIKSLFGMEKEESYRFAFEDQKGWKKHLHDEGFVVIAEYLSKAECEKHVDDFWGIMEILADGTLDRNDPKTQVQSKNYPPVMHGGMIQLWNTKDLKCSFDGLCFMNGTRNYQQRAINSFLHCDQAPIHKEIWSYQGVQTLTNAGQNQGGFVVCPKTNHYHQDYFAKKGMQNVKKNWFLIPQEDKEKEPLTNVFKVNSQAGDFILFDSRTFHCNTIPTVKSLRVCTYICMIPTERVPEKTKVLRKLAVKNKRVSCHHPGDGFRTFPEIPRFLPNINRFKQLQQKVNDYELDEVMKSLI